MTTRLITIADWLDRYFAPAARPSIATVRRWIDDGLVPGRIIGRLYYVNEAAWLAQDATAAARKQEAPAGAYRV